MGQLRFLCFGVRTPSISILLPVQRKRECDGGIRVDLSNDSLRFEAMLLSPAHKPYKFSWICYPCVKHIVQSLDTERNLEFNFSSNQQEPRKTSHWRLFGFGET